MYCKYIVCQEKVKRQNKEQLYDQFYNDLGTVWKYSVCHAYFTQSYNPEVIKVIDNEKCFIIHSR